MSLDNILDISVYRQMTMIFNSMRVNALVKISAGVAIVGVILLILLLHMEFKELNKKRAASGAADATDAEVKDEVTLATATEAELQAAVEEKKPTEPAPAPKANKKIIILTIVVMTLAILASMIAISAQATIDLATKHGRGPADVFETIEQTWHKIDNSPVESTLPEDLTNAIVVYFKYGCLDCEATLEDTQKMLENVSDVYWIATRSKTGEKLREQFPVSEVPSAIVINEDGTYAQKIIYSRQNGKSVIDKDALTTIINRAKNLRKNGTPQVDDEECSSC